MSPTIWLVPTEYGIFFIIVWFSLVGWRLRLFLYWLNPGIHERLLKWEPACNSLYQQSSTKTFTRVHVAKSRTSFTIFFFFFCRLENAKIHRSAQCKLIISVLPSNEYHSLHHKYSFCNVIYINFNVHYWNCKFIDFGDHAHRQQTHLLYKQRGEIQLETVSILYNYW